VRQIAGATTIQTGDGTDTVDVGSEAGFWPTLGFTASRATAMRSARSSTSRAAPAPTPSTSRHERHAPNTGWLTSNQVGGIFKTMTAYVDYSGLETLNVNLGSVPGTGVGNTFIVVSTSPGTVSNVTSGSGNDQFEVQSTAYTTTISTGAGNDTVRLGSITEFSRAPTRASEAR